MLTGLFFVVYFIIKIVGLKSKEGKYPYKFDYSSEFKYYRAVGRNWKKKKDNKQSCDTYIEWKEYFINKFVKNLDVTNSSNNIINFEKYLKKELVSANVYYEAVKVIECPVFITEIAICLEKVLGATTIKAFLIGMIGMLDLLLVTLLIAVILLKKYYEKVCFYEDCIEIIEEYREEKKNNEGIC